VNENLTAFHCGELINQAISDDLKDLGVLGRKATATPKVEDVVPNIREVLGIM